MKDGARRSVRTCRSAGRSRAASPRCSWAPATARAGPPEAVRTATRTDPRVGRRARRAHRLDPPRRAGPGGRRLHRRRVRHRHRRGPGRELGRPLGRRAAPRWPRRGTATPPRSSPTAAWSSSVASRGRGSARSARWRCSHRTGARRPSSASWPTRGAATQPCCSTTGGCWWSAAGWPPTPTRPRRRSSIPMPARSWPGRTSPSPVTRSTPSRSATGGILVAGGQVAPGRATDRAARCSIRAVRHGVRSARWAPLGSSTSWWRSGTVGRWCSAVRPMTRRCSSQHRALRPGHRAVHRPAPAPRAPLQAARWRGGAGRPRRGRRWGRHRRGPRPRPRAVPRAGRAARRAASFATINRLGRRDLLVIGGLRRAHPPAARGVRAPGARGEVMTGHASAVPPAGAWPVRTSSHASSIGPLCCHL